MRDMIRVAHISDIHLTSALDDWAAPDWFSKRVTSWLNHRIVRGRLFSSADDVVARLMDELAQRKVDHVVFSGDASALGFESEFRRAADLLRIGQLPIPGLAVPGNHDYCTRKAESSGAFERCFAPWQEGRRIDGHCYPFAQKVGPVWLIGVNAAKGNRLSFDASGRVGPEQLDRLRRLLAELPAGLRVLVIHYPICSARGRREHWTHGLRDLDELLKVAREGRVSLWLHGHRHGPYHLQQPPGAEFPAICAGTATQRNIWSHGEYSIDGNIIKALRRVYDPDARVFRDAETFELRLP